MRWVAGELSRAPLLAVSLTACLPLLIDIILAQTARLTRQLISPGTGGGGGTGGFTRPPALRDGLGILLLTITRTFLSRMGGG